MTTRAAVDLEYATLRLEQQGRVLTVTVAHPPFNYVNSAMQDDIVTLVDAVAADDSVGAVVVTSDVPSRYVTHFDVADILSTAEQPRRLTPRLVPPIVRAMALLQAVPGTLVQRVLAQSPLGGLHRVLAFQPALAAILTSPAVWIAAVDGPCGGGGLEMSVFFDPRLCSTTATFLLPELSIGLSTTFGGQRLARLMGPTRALELMLESRAYSADESKTCGLVDDVVPAHELIDHARARATRFARRPFTGARGAGSRA